MYINGPDGLDQQVVRMHDLGGVHPPDPLHLVAGFQRFRNALSICQLVRMVKLLTQPLPKELGHLMKNTEMINRKCFRYWVRWRLRFPSMTVSKAR